MAAILSTSFAAAVTDWAASWSLASVTGVQVGHLCSADGELAQVTAVGPGTMVTVRRGVEGTAVTGHARGERVAVSSVTDTLVSEPLGAAAAPLRQATVTLTHAEISGLYTVGQTVIPAPGPGLVSLPVLTYVSFLCVQPYTGLATDVINLVNDAGGHFDVVTLGTAPGLLRNPTGRLFTVLLAPDHEDVSGRLASLTFTAASSTWVNMPVQVWVTAGAAPTTGGHVDNRLTVSATYLVVDVATGALV